MTPLSIERILSFMRICEPDRARALACQVPDEFASAYDGALFEALLSNPKLGADPTAQAMHALVISGARIHARDSNGTPPLCRALLNGNHELALQICELGDPSCARTQHQIDPIHALAIGHARARMTHGFCMEKPTPFDEDCALATASALIDKGCRIDMLDHSKESALHAAAAGGTPEMIRFLLKNGARPDRKNSMELTPLHLAISSRHDECSRILVASINAQEKTSTPAIHHCIQPLMIRETPQVIEARALQLIQWGAHVHAIDGHGRNVADAWNHAHPNNPGFSSFLQALVDRSALELAMPSPALPSALCAPRL